MKSCLVTSSVISKAKKPIIANRPFIFSAYCVQPKLGVGISEASGCDVLDGSDGKLALIVRFVFLKWLALGLYYWVFLICTINSL